MGAARHRDDLLAALWEGELPLRVGGSPREPCAGVHRGGTTKTVTLTEADVAEVAAAVARYQDA
jgi:hypothetical protein